MVLKQYRFSAARMFPAVNEVRRAFPKSVVYPHPSVGFAAILAGIAYDAYFLVQLCMYGGAAYVAHIGIGLATAGAGALLVPLFLCCTKWLFIGCGTWPFSLFAQPENMDKQPIPKKKNIFFLCRMSK